MNICSRPIQIAYFVCFCLLVYSGAIGPLYDEEYKTNESLVIAFFQDLWEVDVWTLNFASLIALCSGLVCGMFIITYVCWYLPNYFLSKVVHKPESPWLGVARFLFEPMLKGAFLSLCIFSLGFPLFYLLLGGAEFSSVLGIEHIAGDFLHNSLDTERTRGGRYGLLMLSLGVLGFRTLWEHLSTCHQIQELLSGRTDVATDLTILERSVLEKQCRTIVKTYLSNATSIVIVYSTFVMFFNFSSEFQSSRQLLYVIMINAAGSKIKGYISSSAKRLLRAERTTERLPRAESTTKEQNTIIEKCVVPLLMPLRFPFQIAVSVSAGLASKLGSFNFRSLCANLVFSAFQDVLMSSGLEKSDAIVNLKMEIQNYVIRFFDPDWFLKHKLIRRLMFSYLGVRLIRLVTSDTLILYLKTKDSELLDKLRKEYLELKTSHEPQTEEASYGEEELLTDEPLVEYLCTVVVRASTQVLILFSILFFWYFSDALRTDTFGKLRKEQFPSYVIFSAFAAVAYDAVLLAEVITVGAKFGWKIYDLLVFYRYRYIQRETRFLLESNAFDEYFKRKFRLLDAMMFSSQLYFLVCLSGGLMVIQLFGIVMMSVNKYWLFTDYMAIPIVLFSKLLSKFVQMLVLRVYSLSKSSGRVPSGRLLRLLLQTMRI
mmetsp:Transcript_7159/g.11389  ORF Transcript_7159/g.11389 Transcript_7159/m.11389 type:complete len:656 (+) Transcript_7159:101-2068(+)